MPPVMIVLISGRNSEDYRTWSKCSLPWLIICPVCKYKSVLVMNSPILSNIVRESSLWRLKYCIQRLPLRDCRSRLCTPFRLFIKTKVKSRKRIAYLTITSHPKLEDSSHKLHIVSWLYKFPLLPQVWDILRSVEIGKHRNYSSGGMMSAVIHESLCRINYSPIWYSKRCVAILLPKPFSHLSFLVNVLFFYLHSAFQQDYILKSWQTWCAFSHI